VMIMGVERMKTRMKMLMPMLMGIVMMRWQMGDQITLGTYPIQLPCPLDHKIGVFVVVVIVFSSSEGRLFLGL
jgi:hypothetical protein